MNVVGMLFNINSFCSSDKGFPEVTIVSYKFIGYIKVLVILIPLSYVINLLLLLALQGKTSHAGKKTIPASKQHSAQIANIRTN